MRSDPKSVADKSACWWTGIHKRLAGINPSASFHHTKSYLSKNAPRSLANRILVLQLIWAVIVYVLFIAALWLAMNLIIESSVRQQGEGWISKLDELGIPIYASNDPSQMSDVLGYVRNFPEIVSAQYLDISGNRITAKYTRKNSVISDFSSLNSSTIEQLMRTDVVRKTILFEKGANSQMHVSAPIWIKSIANDGMINFSLKKTAARKSKPSALLISCWITARYPPR